MRMSVRGGEAVKDAGGEEVGVVYFVWVEGWIGDCGFVFGLEWQR
jgi:hypothetical protein